MLHERTRWMFLRPQFSMISSSFASPPPGPGYSRFVQGTLRRFLKGAMASLWEYLPEANSNADYIYCAVVVALCAPCPSTPACALLIVTAG
jgi:hypothetical protein